MKYRRAGEPTAPTPLRAHRAVDVSARATREPGRGVAIRGLAEHVETRRQTEPSWRETWAEELAVRDLDVLIERDPLAALCQIVRDAGGTMRLHGAAIGEHELRAVAKRRATYRILAAAAPGVVAGERGPEEHW